MAQLRGKVAIVTGSSKGIGAAIAEELAGAGAAVIVNYASDKAGADRVVAAITQKDGRAIAVRADLSVAADVKELFAAAVREFGRLDILVNNAGYYGFAPLEEVTEAAFHKHYDINVLGPLLATQEAVKHFDAAGGNIINVSSVAATSPVVGAVLYSSTKGALDTLTRGYALELAPRKIRVNAVSPGFTVTEGVKSTGILDSDFATKIVAETPLGRAGLPEDIARVVLFLASDASGWITGEVVRVSGGTK